MERFIIDNIPQDYFPINIFIIYKWRFLCAFWIIGDNVIFWNISLIPSDQFCMVNNQLLWYFERIIHTGGTHCQNNKVSYYWQHYYVTSCTYMHTHRQRERTKPDISKTLDEFLNKDHNENVSGMVQNNLEIKISAMNDPANLKCLDIKRPFNTTTYQPLLT